jgi:2-dehydro-3-deoxyphosphogluconate aldolase / (4S)-4-hydroxy-2-oxoglutarate aldolase
MTQVAWLNRLQQQKVIAVIRAAELEVGVAMAKAVAAGGLRLIEVTWNSGDPVKLVHTLQTELPNCCVGAGTLLTLADLQAALAAGAEFLFSPHTDRRLIQTALRHQVPVIPGALSPSEILTAWQAGATCVKVFPVESVGGAAYIRHLQGPMGQIPLIPTGGVTLENASSFIRAGAVAVGLAGQLFPQQAVQTRDWTQIRLRAASVLEQLRWVEQESNA